MRLAHLLARLREDRRGASALEFAIIAPTLILCWFGVVETGSAIVAGRRTAHAVNALADLVAQKPQVSDTDLQDCFEAAEEVMKPFAATSLKLKITSVTVDDKSVPRVDWSSAKNGLTPDTVGATISDLPANLITKPGESLVLSRAEFTLIPASTTVLKMDLSWKRVAFVKPRAGKVSRAS